MAKKQIIIGAIVLGLVIGGAVGITMTKGSPTLAQGQQVVVPTPLVPGPQTNTKIEQLKTELDSVAQYEMAYGCMTFDKFGKSTFCGASKDRVDALQAQLTEETHKLELANRSPEALATVAARIKELSGNPSTDVVFQGTSANPYTNTVKRIEHWSDSRGFDYMVNPENNAVVQFGPGPESKTTFELDGSKSLSADALRQKAEEFLSKNVADFDQVKADYSFRTMSKPGNVSYAFRWEAKSKPTGEDVLPFVQIVLSPAGEVMSFNDVRSLYSN